MTQDPSAGAPAETLDPKRFPYLAFMLAASRAAPLSSDGRVPKKTVEAWLRENWPNELGAPTPNKITNMATFLRRPDEERGGNHAKDRDH